MPIDTSILGGYQPPKQENLFNTLAQFEAIRSAQQQGQMNALQMQKAQREAEREQQLNALYSQAYNPQTGTIDPQRLTGAMAQGGFGSMIPGVQKGFAEAEAARTEARRKQVDLSKAQYEAMGKHADEFSRLLRPDMNPDVYKAMLAAKRADPTLGPIYDSMGQSLQDELAEVDAAVQGGVFSDFINREIMGAKEVSKMSRDASALKRAMENAASAVSPTSSVGPSEAVPGTPDQIRGGQVSVQAANDFDRNVVADLADQGRNDLAMNYIDQQMKLAQLPNAGVPERVQFLRALMNDPKLMAAERGLQEAGASQQTFNLGKELTPYQKKLDEKAADDVLEWKQGGGTTMVGNIRRLRGVVAQLERGEGLSGPITGITPDFILAFSESGRKAIDARQKVEQVVQQDLRRILGAQFTEKEGDRFLARVFDPKLKPRQLAARVKDLLTQMEQAAIQKQSMAEYLDDNGTLRGYKGPQPTLRAIEDALFGAKGAGGTSAGAAPKNVDQQLWDVMTPEERKLWSK